MNGHDCAYWTTCSTPTPASPTALAELRQERRSPWNIRSGMRANSCANVFTAVFTCSSNLIDYLTVAYSYANVFSIVESLSKSGYVDPD